MELDLAQADFDIAEEEFNSYNERFQTVNAEKKYVEEVARQKQLADERDEVFNMARKDTETIATVGSIISERL